MNVVQSGIQHLIRSINPDELMKAMNIDPAMMKEAVNGFGSVMKEIQTHLLAIEREQARQGAILEKLTGDDHEQHARGLGHPPAVREIGKQIG